MEANNILYTLNGLNNDLSDLSRLLAVTSLRVNSVLSYINKVCIISNC